MALVLPLPGKCIGSDVAKRGFHGIRLGASRAISFSFAPIITPPGRLLPERVPRQLRGPRARPPAARACTTAPVASRCKICPLKRWLRLIRIFTRISRRRRTTLSHLRAHAPLATSARSIITARASRRTVLIIALPGRTVPRTTPTGITAQFGAADGAGQSRDIAFIELDKRPPLEAARQKHGAIPDADQTADGMADRFEHAPHFPIAPFGNRNPVPAVGPLPAAGFNGAKRSHAIVERHTLKQPLFLLVAKRAQYTNRILPLQPKSGVHELVSQFARTCQQEQTFRVEVQPAYRLPFTLKQFRQTPENGRPVLGVVVRHHLTCGLVIRNNPRRRRVDAYTNWLAIDFHTVAKLDALADMSGLRIDRYTSFQNQLLHLQARPETGLR